MGVMSSSTEMLSEWFFNDVLINDALSHFPLSYLVLTVNSLPSVHLCLLNWFKLSSVGVSQKGKHMLAGLEVFPRPLCSSKILFT